MNQAQAKKKKKKKKTTFFLNEQLALSKEILQSFPLNW